MTSTGAARNWRVVLLAGVSAACAGMGGAALAQPAAFIPIPDLPGGTVLSRSQAISADARIVLGTFNSTNGDVATDAAIEALIREVAEDWGEFSRRVLVGTFLKTSRPGAVAPAVLSHILVPNEPQSPLA